MAGLRKYADDMNMPKMSLYVDIIRCLCLCVKESPLARTAYVRGGMTDYGTTVGVRETSEPCMALPNARTLASRMPTTELT